MSKTARSWTRRQAVTVLELIVTLTLIGLIAAVGTLVFPPDRRPSPTDPLARIAGARSLAVERGRPVSLSIVVSGRLVDALALPDGSIIADSAVLLDRLSGRP